MPFKSIKQAKYMNAQAAAGNMDKSMVEEFNKKSSGMNLPDKVQTPKLNKYFTTKGRKHLKGYQ